MIPLCKNSTDRYHLNILRIIVIIYHIYIEYELYNLSYTKIYNIVVEQEFICSTIRKWDDHDSYTKIFHDQGR